MKAIGLVALYFAIAFAKPLRSGQPSVYTKSVGEIWTPCGKSLARMIYFAYFIIMVRSMYP